MKSILIIEDQPEIRRLIRMTLELEDYEIHEAADGAQGLRAAHRLQPDLVLLDVMMPGLLDGLQVCEALKRDLLLPTEVVLLTARGRAQDRQAGLRAGADDYLVKPFSPLELIETVEERLAASLRDLGGPKVSRRPPPAPAVARRTPEMADALEARGLEGVGYGSGGASGI